MLAKIAVLSPDRKENTQATCFHMPRLPISIVQPAAGDSRSLGRCHQPLSSEHPEALAGDNANRPGE